MTENQLGELQMMEEVAEHVGINSPETPLRTCKILRTQLLDTSLICK